MPPQPKGKMMLIDTSRCMACRGCQVACKDWHQLPAEETTFVGTYENPPDLSGVTLSRVRFSEVDGPVFMWLFFKDQCRHCMNPKCQHFCPVGNAIEVTSSGAVVITDSCNPTACRNRPCERMCPYGIPRFNGDKETKCDLCFDRIEAGKSPICAKTCPPGAITFGDSQTVIDEANARLAELAAEYPNAEVYPDSFLSTKPGAGTRVGWILVDCADKYGL